MKKFNQWGISAVFATVASAATIGLTLPANAQAVGERAGDVCRVVDISSDTQLFLYEAPDTTSASVVAMFDGEQINLIRRNVAGEDGLVYHEIEDSAGNFGYIEASDPVDGTSTIVNCNFDPFW
ncbi:MAG: hypothetical protein SWY16_05055 [Cyanobacteriota bacterium]|nr:hypothetical protein [Cyanobacteriota bacterium]